MKHIKRDQFIWDFQNHETIPNCYKKVLLNETVFTNETARANPEPVLYVSLVPTYLDYVLVNHNAYHHKKISHKGKDGAGMLLNGENTVDSYLQKFAKRQLRINLKRAITRLEESFNITYEYNFGSITNEKCQFLLTEMRHLLENRFQEKNMENMFLKEWELHTANLEALIRAKKASLFVVYDEEKPISISLNVHIKNSILFSKSNAYDTDYAKFSLGHLDNYLLLKWCLENNYQFLDLGFGIMDYKIKWCNLFYNFDYHIYSKKGSFLATGIAILETTKIKLKNGIKTFKIRERLRHIKSIAIKTKETETATMPRYKQEILSASEAFQETDLMEINIKDTEYKAIRQPIYDYLYAQKMHLNTIKTYKVEENTFLCKTGEHLIKITRL